MHRVVRFILRSEVNGETHFRYVSAVKKNRLLFRAAIFAQQKTNAAEQAKSDRHVIKSHQGGKYATPDFIRGCIDDGPLRPCPSSAVYVMLDGTAARYLMAIMRVYDSRRQCDRNA